MVFTSPSVPLLGDRNPQGREDVTALSADFSTSPSLLQGELHILTKPSLLRKEGCNRPPVLGTATL